MISPETRALAIVRDIEQAPRGHRRALVIALIDSSIGETITRATTAMRRLSLPSSIAGAHMLYSTQAQEAGQEIAEWIEVCRALCQDESFPEDIRQQAAMTQARCLEFSAALVNTLSALNMR